MRRCDHTWKADALEAGTLDDGEAASFERHARTCRACRDRRRDGERLRMQLSRLPRREPAALAVRRVRERVLSDAHAAATRSAWWPRPVEWRSPAVVIALAAAAGVALLARDRRSPAAPEPSYAATIAASPDAVWSRSRAAGVETVRISRGEAWIVVRKQLPAERFLVETPDAELEVRGTTFEVEVDGTTTRHVRVVEGKVAVHVRDRPSIELGAGQAWDADATAARPAPPASASPVEPAALDSDLAAAPPAALRAASPPVVPAPRGAAPRPPAPTDATADYGAAMGLYRSGRYSEAAEGFRRFVSRHHGSELAEDASFLEALALTRAGHVDAGAVAAWRHLTEFPGSFHRKEASILVARAARDRGDCAEVRRALAPWLAEGKDDPSVREALGPCVDP